MNNNFEELWDEMKQVDDTYVRDLSLAVIPSVLLPGVGTIISSILIGKRFKKYCDKVEETSVKHFYF